MSKHDENRERTKTNLKEAFWDLYKTKSIHEIRVKDITDKAGYHRATFYLYYTDVYALLDEEVQEIISYVANRSHEFKELPISESVLILKDYFDIYGDRLNLLLGARYSDELVTKFKQIMFPKFRKNLGMEETLKNEIICEFTLHGMQMAFRCWYRHKDELSLTEFTRLLQTIVLKGTVAAI